MNVCIDNLFYLVYLKTITYAINLFDYFEQFAVYELCFTISLIYSRVHTVQMHIYNCLICHDAMYFIGIHIHSTWMFVLENACRILCNMQYAIRPNIAKIRQNASMCTLYRMKRGKILCWQPTTECPECVIPL